MKSWRGLACTEKSGGQAGRLPFVPCQVCGRSSLDPDWRMIVPGGTKQRWPGCLAPIRVARAIGDQAFSQLSVVSGGRQGLKSVFSRPHE